MPWLRPDGKTQVTIEYKKEGGAMIPIRVHTILISTQHSPDVTNDKIHADLMEHVIKPVVPSKYMDDKTIFHLNPSGAVRPPAHDILPASAPVSRAYACSVQAERPHCVLCGCCRPRFQKGLLHAVEHLQAL